MKKTFIAIAFAGSLFFTGCAQMGLGGTTSSDINSYTTSKKGVVVGVQEVEINDNGVGTILGAAVGGVLGNQVGGGTGKTVATVAGAVLGGAAGNTLNHKQGQKLTIRLNDGSTLTTVEDNFKHRVGDRVTISFKNGGISSIY